MCEHCGQVRTHIFPTHVHHVNSSGRITRTVSGAEQAEQSRQPDAMPAYSRNAARPLLPALHAYTRLR